MHNCSVPCPSFDGPEMGVRRSQMEQDTEPVSRMVETGHLGRRDMEFPPSKVEFIELGVPILGLKNILP